MKVYRVEDSSGRGAYRVDLYWHPDTNRQPAPWTDTRLKDAWSALEIDGTSNEFIFGFESVAALQRWFHDEEWLRRAAESGLHVATYDVPDDVRNGSSQLVFRKDAARRESATSISTIQ